VSAKENINLEEIFAALVENILDSGRYKDKNS